MKPVCALEYLCRIYSPTFNRTMKRAKVCATKQPQGTDNGPPTELWEAVPNSSHTSKELYN
jgi:hypothetical protein